ncbi:hypothetical protein [Nocardia sp. NPDC005745]|uniref:hypothetical protein n=1 Tax=Nocardia sp. NPDC005745 TaxID=3157061 RepID=UPI0033E3000B
MAIAVALGAAACGDESSGSPATTTTQAAGTATQLFDPSTGIPDATLTSAKTRLCDVLFPARRGCRN